VTAAAGRRDEDFPAQASCCICNGEESSSAGRRRPAVASATVVEHGQRSGN